MQRVDPVPNCLVMIRPADFGFNEETFADNVFQKHTKLTHKEVLERAQKEFDDYVAVLREKGLKVIVIDKTKYPELASVKMPDDVFPNWFSTELNGTLVTYKMHTKARENEKALKERLEQALYDEGYKVTATLDIGSRFDNKDYCLEGTGTMVFDRKQKVIFAGLSQRCNPEYLASFCEKTGYRLVSFETAMTNGEPLYHTDLYFCMGQEFAVVCLEAILDKYREKVREELVKMGKEIIELTLEQVEQHFCGNILEIQSKKDGKKYVIMSKTAHAGFREDQLAKISKHAEIISVAIPTIEEVGGGSAKCMLTECLLPERDVKADN